MNRASIKHFAVSVLCVAAMNAVSTAKAEVITFDGVGPDAFFGMSFGPYEVAVVTGSWFGSGYGNPGSSIYDGPVGGPTPATIRIERAFSTSFTFSSFDYSCNNGGGVYSVAGLSGGILVYSNVGAMTPSFPPDFGFSTAVSVDPLVSMDTLFISFTPFDGCTSINIDNITLFPVPAPSAMLVFGIPGLMSRRRR